MDDIRLVNSKISELKQLLKRIEELQYRILDICDHEFEKEIPSGSMRDNGEFDYRCRKCGFLK